MSQAHPKKNRIRMILMLVVSLLLTGAGVAGYVWNEQRAHDLAEGYKNSVGVYTLVDPAVVDGANARKKIYFTTTLGPGATLKDPQFALQAPDAVLLERQVFMYQWTEETKKGASHDTYHYTLKWEPDYVDSRTFAILDKAYFNPTPLVTRSIFSTEAPVLGAYRVSPLTLIQFLSSKLTLIPYPASYIAAFPAGWRERLEINPVNKSDLLVRVQPGKGSLGDLDLRYLMLPAGMEVTVAGTQQGGFIYPVDYLVPGKKTMAELFGSPPRGVENNIWQARAAAGAVMLVGFALFFYLLGQHRFAGNIVRKGGYIFAALCAVAFAGGQISGYYWQGIPKVTYQIYLVALCGAVLLAAYVLLAFLSAFIHYRKARRMVVRAAAAELKISPAPAASEPPSSSSEQR